MTAVPAPTPTASTPRGALAADTPLTLQATPFAHPTGGAHGASQWQISADCTDFTAPVTDRWVQHENWFQGEDTLAGVDLTTLAADLPPAGDWCWRVRYRDRGLAWSAWSEPAAFAVPG